MGEPRYHQGGQLATWWAGLFQVPGCLGPRCGNCAARCRRLLSAWRPSHCTHWDTLGRGLWSSFFLWLVGILRMCPLPSSASGSI